MFINYLQYRLGQIQQSVTFWRICANLIENEPLVTSADKQNSVRQWSRMQESSSPIKLYTEFFILEIEIIAKIINNIFSLLLIIAMRRVSSFFMPASLKLSMHLAKLK